MTQCVDKDVFQGEFYEKLSPKEKKSIITTIQIKLKKKKSVLTISQKINI